MLSHSHSIYGDLGDDPAVSMYGYLGFDEVSVVIFIYGDPHFLRIFSMQTQIKKCKKMTSRAAKIRVCRQEIMSTKMLFVPNGDKRRTGRTISKCGQYYADLYVCLSLAPFYAHIWRSLMSSVIVTEGRCLF